MKTIQLLPDHVIAQIAAGEVIERPAYAVKELIENAVDAKATSIRIDLIDSGLAKLIVTDNGMGMNKEDILESFKLHTTSKIQNSESLLSIHSLGFRGEALASIAAMSFLTIESKKESDNVGTKVEVVSGKLNKILSLGMPTGTRVIVDHLFSTVPARKKFLKTKRTELRHILDVTVAHSLCSPEIAFQLSHEGKMLLDLPKSSLGERLQLLFNQEITQQLLPVTFTDSRLSLTGYIGMPQLSHLSQTKQFLMINGRPVTDRLIQLAIKEAYGVLLPDSKQPTWFLSLSVPFETVDANIHPRKEEVTIVDQRYIFDMVHKATHQTLQHHSLSFTTTPSGVDSQHSYVTKTPLSKQLKEQVLPWNTKLLTHAKGDTILQIHNVYIIYGTNTGMVIIDQHAAHERILYERFVQQYLIEKTVSTPTPLDAPVLLELTQSELLLLEECNESLEQMGFRLNVFSGSTIHVSHVPSLFQGRDNKVLLFELLRHFGEHSFIPSIDTVSRKLLAFLSCKAAVKAGDPLTTQQMKDIVEALEHIPHAVTCPHGRPVKIITPLRELDKQFKRR